MINTLQESVDKCNKFVIMYPGLTNGERPTLKRITMNAQPHINELMNPLYMLDWEEIEQVTVDEIAWLIVSRDDEEEIYSVWEV